MDPSDWKELPSGILVPKNYSPGRKAALTWREALAALRRWRPRGRTRNSHWTKWAAIGQLASAVVALAAILIALWTQTNQGVAAERSNAQKVSINLESFVLSRVTVRVYNHSTVTLYNVKLVAGPVENFWNNPETRLFDAKSIPPCSYQTMVFEADSPVYSAMVGFSESTRSWILEAFLIRSLYSDWPKIVEAGVLLSSEIEELSNC